MNRLLIMMLLSLNFTTLEPGVASQEANDFSLVSVLKDEEIKEGWATTKVNIRTDPSTSSLVLGTVDFNEKITYVEENEEWVKIAYNNIDAYIYKKYISDSECKSISYEIPDNQGFKSYMDYRAITAKNSTQYKIQNEYAYTGKYGIRQVGNRYCIALGTHYGAELGQFVDLKLENGVVIKCVLSEVKADKDTDKNNIFTSNGCCSEFIIESESLNKSAKKAGNVSSCTQTWNSPVKEIIIYEKTIFE